MPGMPGMPGMQPQGMPGGPMGGPMPGPMAGPMGGAPPQGGYSPYGGHPGTYGAPSPAANDPMWGCFTAIAGQVSVDKPQLLTGIIRAAHVRIFYVEPFIQGHILHCRLVFTFTFQTEQEHEMHSLQIFQVL